MGPISPYRLRNNRGVVELWNETGEGGGKEEEEEEGKEGSGLAGILHRDYFESKPSAMAIKGAQGVCFNKERNIEWQGADINFQVYLIERGKGTRRRERKRTVGGSGWGGEGKGENGRRQETRGICGRRRRGSGLENMLNGSRIAGSGSPNKRWGHAR